LEISQAGKATDFDSEINNIYLQRNQNMNYKKIYDSLITRAKNRKLTEFTESHHIIPRCMGGNNDRSNLADLTPEEHYIAHQLLVKLYPKNHALVRAASMMIPSRPSNKLYGWIRRKLSEAMSDSQSGVGNSQFGTKWIFNRDLQESKRIPIEQSVPAGWKNGRVIDFLAEQSVFNECPVCKKLKKSIRKFCSLSCSATYHNISKTTIFDIHLDDMIKDYKNGMSIYKCLISRNLCGTGANHVKLSNIVKTIGA
jgi:hypothetical protein